MKTWILIYAMLAAALGSWIVWTEYRITGLEIRMNVHEASEHWQETPEVAR